MIVRASSSAWLALVWFASFVLVMSTPLIALMLGDVEQATALSSMERISSLYAPYVGSILAFMLVERAGRETRSVSRTAFIVALGSSIIWNCIVCIFVLHVFWEPVPLEDATVQAASIASKLSWLVAPVMGYYFAKPNVELKGSEGQDSSGNSGLKRERST